jgi:hypothetical protein
VNRKIPVIYIGVSVYHCGGPLFFAYFHCMLPERIPQEKFSYSTYAFCGLRVIIRMKSKNFVNDGSEF